MRTLHRCVFTLASLVAVVATAAPARAATIDFESLALDAVVTNQFAADGILFGNAVNLVAGISLNEFDFPPSSGTNVISGLGPGPLTMSFTAPAQLVSLQLTTGDVAAVSFYDSANALLGQALVASNLGGNTLVSFAAGSPSIASVSVASQATGSAFFLTVDDVTFESGSTAAIPEPSAFLAMASGLVMVASAVRRRA